MRIAIFLCPAQTAQLRTALESHDEICSADSWTALENLIRVEPLSVVVFNPAADGTLDITRACRLIRRYRSIPFVAYVPLDAPFIRGIAHMSNEGLQDLVVVRAGDSPPRFRETLARVSSVQELSSLLEAMQPLLERLPIGLSEVLVDSLRRPHKYASAEDIAAAAGMTVSGLYRSFRCAHINSPKRYVVGARVFRGYLYLRDAGFSVRDIAAKLGYTHPRIFARQIESVFGERPSRVRHSLELDGAVTRLVSWFSEPEPAYFGILPSCIEQRGPLTVPVLTRPLVEELVELSLGSNSH